MAPYGGAAKWGAMESVQVEIFGQVYSIKGKDDPAYIRDLAAFIDSKMKEVQKGTGTSDPLRVAILSVLTITDELFRLRQQNTVIESVAGNSVQRLLELTEEAGKQ